MSRAGRQTTREDAMDAREGLEPGCIMVHLATGTAVSLKRRKDDDSGWWNTDGSGLADAVIEDGSWVPAVRLLAAMGGLRADRDRWRSIAGDLWNLVESVPPEHLPEMAQVYVDEYEQMAGIA